MKLPNIKVNEVEPESKMKVIFEIDPHNERHVREVKMYLEAYNMASAISEIKNRHLRSHYKHDMPAEGCLELIRDEILDVNIDAIFD